MAQRLRRCRGPRAPASAAAVVGVEPCDGTAARIRRASMPTSAVRSMKRPSLNRRALQAAGRGRCRPASAHADAEVAMRARGAAAPRRSRSPPCPTQCRYQALDRRGWSDANVAVERSAARSRLLPAACRDRRMASAKARNVSARCARRADASMAALRATARSRYSDDRASDCVSIPALVPRVGSSRLRVERAIVGAVC